MHGVTNATLPARRYKTGNRIQDGWYELPGDTQYYGLDGKGSALIGAETGVGALQDIDSGCGPTGKAVFDAAQIADPEIDYDNFDTDKDGVVDFFMMVFPGLGGNGDSQINGAALRQHLAALVGPAEQLHRRQRREGLRHPRPVARPRGPAAVLDRRDPHQDDDDHTGIPVYVRVGPYNVNPETAITNASVISHEYGHSLGLPDYYSTGSRTTYGGWTLMAEDHSQNIDVIGKKELGWLVPRVLGPGQTRSRAGRTPSTTPAGSTGSSPTARRTRSTARASTTARPTWRGCPGGGSSTRRSCPRARTCVVGLRQRLRLPARRAATTSTWRSPRPGGHAKVTLSFKSRWDVEWDFDYGFVLASTDNGKTYASYPSANGYTTPATRTPTATAARRPTATA